MEYLDIYDENHNYLGKEERSIVHRDALWHNTVHCWLYDNQGNVYFQIRKDEGKLYTTASGHVLSGETVKQGFGREIREEIGLKINYEEANLVNVNKFVIDLVKKDGSLFRDRAFSNVYLYEYDGNDKDFNFDALGQFRLSRQCYMRIEGFRIKGNPCFCQSAAYLPR